MEGGSLHYYNQFAIKKNEDGLRYIMLLFQELSLKQEKTKITFWGNIDANSKFISLLKKYEEYFIWKKTDFNHLRI